MNTSIRCTKYRIFYLSISFKQCLSDLSLSLFPLLSACFVYWEDLRSGAGVKSLLYATNEQMPHHISMEFSIHSSTHNYNSIKLKILNIRPEELNSSNVYAISSPLLSLQSYSICFVGYIPSNIKQIKHSQQKTEKPQNRKERLKIFPFYSR